ncbi:MAG: multiheme c-type cytochrome, partial [Burkholderiales bacterium]
MAKGLIRIAERLEALMLTRVNLQSAQTNRRGVFRLLLGCLFAVLAVLPAGAAETMDPHAEVLAKAEYPTAKQCAVCHQQIYEEWSYSAHAYAAISPMFHKFEQKINDVAPTISGFCVRCHIGPGTAQGESREIPLWERSQVSREGVTCVSCHRVDTAYGRANAERRILSGPIFDPVYGPIGGDGVAAVAKNKDELKVATDSTQRGTKMHNQGIKFDQLSKSEFCVSCHQVAVNVGIKLEVVWEQYRDSPAAKKGITCQQCHMSDTPGLPSGFASAPVVRIRDQIVTPARTRHNHSFIGPGYSVAHPGIFPHHPDAENWSVEEWLQFNYRAGWGSDDFENKLQAGEIDVEFPDAWSDESDRREARRIVEANQAKLALKRAQRRELMEAGSKIEGPFFAAAPKAGRDLEFSYRITNLNEGHNLPSGSLGAQPEIWFNVALIGPDGKNLWESGYLDSYGDMADLHSIDVRNGKIAHDAQLFNLQTKFLTTNVKGTDREMYLPVNFDIDQLPFLRPPAQPVSTLNHPPFVRMEGRSLPPLGNRMAKYKVPAALVSNPGEY